MEEEQSSFSLKRFLFGSIGKKLGLAFGVLIIFIIVLVLVTYSINRQIEGDAKILADVESPLNIMVEQVIGYDAILTGNAHEALLHVEKKEYSTFEEHRAKYDEAGLLLDNLLKYAAPELINKSVRSIEDKKLVETYLTELDRINLELVELETSAFEAMEKGDSETARHLIVSNQYEDYKRELADYYQKWALLELKVSEEYQQKIARNTRNIEIYNLGLGILFIIFALVIPFLISKSVTKPLIDLKKATERLKEGNLETRVEIKSGDEIQELGESFNKTIEALNSADKERKQLDKAKTEFLSITSHELRSPMTPMRAQLQMLLGNYFGKMNEKQRESLDIVLRNTERLDKITQDFLEISRIEAARLKFNFVKVSLNKSIHNLIDEMKGFMPEKKIKLTFESNVLPVIECDPDRVMQVLRNLVNNAIKFSNENGRIVIRTEIRKNDILFSVKDDGLGMKKEDQVRLFEPFYQVDNMYQHKSGGTGLGLAISKGIIESQNGKIWFESDVGKGTTFYFTVPFQPVKEMRPIRILFSPVDRIEKELRSLFIDYLGPMGEKEFEELKISKKIVESSLNSYVSEIKKQGILRKEFAEEFKNNISLVFKDKKEDKAGLGAVKIGVADLVKRGIVKK